jgi:hypothetical protein
MVITVSPVWANRRGGANHCKHTTKSKKMRINLIADVPGSGRQLYGGYRLFFLQ